MNQATVECLHLNGTFALPNPSLQDALLQTFAECVLPSMPIVEWQPLVHALHEGNGSHGSISLLLYHAIMVSATAFVDMRYILEAGYSTRQEAQESFFQKARVREECINYQWERTNLSSSCIKPIPKPTP